MFDLTWGDAGITIYYPGNNNGGYPPNQAGGPYNPYATQSTTFSTGTLVLLAVLAYLLLKK